MERKFHKITRLLLTFLILLSICCVGIASAFDTVYAKDGDTTEQATSSEESAATLTEEEKNVIEAFGATPTSESGQQDSEGHYILGATPEGGTISTSSDLSTLAGMTFGDRLLTEEEVAELNRPQITPFASGSDTMPNYWAVYFTLNGDTIETTSPVIYISDDGAYPIAYCADPTLNVPGETAGFGNSVTYIKDVTNTQPERVRNIIYWGYRNGDAATDYVKTWCAIRVVMGLSDYSNYYMTDSYVANLVNNLSYKNPPNWNGNWQIQSTQEEATWNRATQRQETGWYETICTNIDEHGQYTVNLPDGVHAICRDTNGQTYGDYTGSFTIFDDDDFMLYADASYTGDFTIDISPTTKGKTSTDSRIPSGCVIYYPNVANTQRLFVSLAVDDRPVSFSGQIHASFKSRATPTTFTKYDDETKAKLANAHLQIFNAEDNSLVAEADTDSNGNFTADLVPGNYYIKETKAPTDYELLSDPIYFTVTGNDDSMNVDVPNTAKKVPFSFKKVDETGIALDGVVFQLYACETNEAYAKPEPSVLGTQNIAQNTDNHQHSEMFGETDSCWTNLIDEVTTGEDGIANFGQLRSGEYQLVEVKTKPGYQLPHGQWRIIVDAENETIEIVAKRESLPPAFATTDSGYQLVNYTMPDMPHAGIDDPTTAILATIGAALIGGAVIVLFYQNRNKIGKVKK